MLCNVYERYEDSQIITTVESATRFITTGILCLHFYVYFWWFCFARPYDFAWRM